MAPGVLLYLLKIAISYLFFTDLPHTTGAEIVVRFEGQSSRRLADGKESKTNKILGSSVHFYYSGRRHRVKKCSPVFFSFGFLGVELLISSW